MVQDCLSESFKGERKLSQKAFRKLARRILVPSGKESDGLV